jgi:hypothetical protein
MTITSYVGGVSTHYVLPIIDPNDADEDGVWDTQFSAKLEKRYADIIENNVYGTARALSINDYMTRANGVIRESDFYLLYEDNGNIACICDELECIINGVYIEIFNVRWNDLIAGQTYYLFLKLVEEDRTNESVSSYLSSREFANLLAITKNGLTTTNIELYMGMVTPPSLTGIYGQGYFGQGSYGS